jgi:hypothetical protein
VISRSTGREQQTTAPRRSIRTVLVSIVGCIVVATAVSCTSSPSQLPSERDAVWFYPVVKRPWIEEDARIEDGVTVMIAEGEYELVLLALPQGAGELVLPTAELPRSVSVSVYALPPVTVERKTRWFDSRNVTGPWLDPCVPLAATPDGYAIPRGIEYLLLEIYREDASGATEIDTAAFQIGGEIDGTPLPPLDVVPLDFSLPWNHSVPVLAWIGYEEVIGHHRNRGLLPWDEEAVWLDYLRVLRAHRIVPYDPLPSDDFDWDLFEEIAIPLFTGRLTPDRVPAPAVRFRESPFRDGSPEDVAYLDRMIGRLVDEGLLERTIYYVADEPLLGDYTSIVTEAERIQSIAPEIRTLVTEPYTPALAQAIDIWCVDIPFYSIPVPLLPVYGRGTGLYPDFQISRSGPAYRREAGFGREFWMYTCMSAQFLGYPNLFIDAPASAQRVIPWLLYLRNGSGMIHYHTTYAYADGNDPWIDQHFFSANGDGTLLYPGRPDIDGYHRHGAIASLRLKLLRDGLEDIEYLLLLEGQEATLPSVDAIVRSGLRWERDHSAYLIVRAEIARRIQMGSNK